MARRCIGMFTIVLAFFSSVACSSHGGISNIVTPAETTFVTTLTVRADNGEPSATFRKGEAILFDLQVKNVSGKPQHVAFTSACHFGFSVRDEATGRAVLDEPEICATVLTSLDFGPGETKSFTLRWAQTDSAGKPVDGGTYAAQGRMLAGASGTESDWQSFKID